MVAPLVVTIMGGFGMEENVHTKKLPNSGQYRNRMPVRVFGRAINITLNPPPKLELFGVRRMCVVWVYL